MAIADRARFPHHYERGQVLFYEGNAPLAVFCIESGIVRLSRAASDGSNTLVSTRTSGDLMGYRAVLANVPYSLTAVTLEPSNICAIPRDAFLELIGQSPTLALELLRRLSLVSQLTEDQLVSRSRERALARTARFLLRMQGRHAVGPAPTPINVDREEMALMIGTTRETLSRTLNALARRGMVALAGSKVRVLDTAALERLIRT